MPRPPRIDEPGSFHHLTNRGRNRQRVFFDEHDYEAFLYHLGWAAERCAVEIHAYTLMPNHYHLLVRSLDGRLSDMMQLVGGSYTQDFNTKHACDGSLFKGRFFSKVIDSEGYLLETFRYVPNNPVKAGMVERAQDHRWSSYASIIGLGPAVPFLEQNALVKEFFHGDPTAFDAFVRRADTPEGTLLAHVLDHPDGGHSLKASLARAAQRRDRLMTLSVRQPMLRPVQLLLQEFVCDWFDIGIYELADATTPDGLDARAVLLVLARERGIAAATALAAACGLSTGAVYKAIQHTRLRSETDAEIRAALVAGRNLLLQAA